MVGKRKLANGEKKAQGPDKRVAYENERNVRLEQNRQRMLELGIPNLSNLLSSSLKAQTGVSTPRTAKLKLNHDKHSSVCVIRRSSRLQHAAPVSYKESLERTDLKEDGKMGWLSKQRAAKRPEIYTEEHEKLLGSWEKPWELFKDGCDASGSRIYDSVKGKTCHQCRQKTLGHRTWCSSCKALHGQFCGDCLFMRYGENVLEVKQNKSWICPVCRGICNCSFCRPKQGWAPTGSLYRKAVALGYKSVAHYLIFTHRAVPNTYDE